MEIPRRHKARVAITKSQDIQYPHSFRCVLTYSSSSARNRGPPALSPHQQGRAAHRRRTAIILKSIKCHRGFLSRSNVRSAQAPRHPNLWRVRCRRIIDEAAALSIGRREIADNSVNPQVRSCERDTSLYVKDAKAIIFALFLHKKSVSPGFLYVSNRMCWYSRCEIKPPNVFPAFE